MVEECLHLRDSIPFEAKRVDPGYGDRSPLTDNELAAWHGMLTVYSRIMRDLDRDLITSHRISVREFDVLITLANSPDHRLRMSDLAEHVMLTPSGLTRLVDRLERERLVERRSFQADARSMYTVLTDAGETRLNEARGTHNAVIRAHFTDRLTSEELCELGALWQRVLSDGRELTNAGSACRI